MYYVSEEIKSRLRSGNACYHSVQNVLSSRLLSKNLKVKIYRNIIVISQSKVKYKYSVIFVVLDL